jgi:hypothetical protein
MRAGKLNFSIGQSVKKHQVIFEVERDADSVRAGTDPAVEQDRPRGRTAY